MDADERNTYIYLESWPGQKVSGIEIARRAGGKTRYRDNPNWAVEPLGRLVETEILLKNWRWSVGPSRLAL